MAGQWLLWLVSGSRYEQIQTLGPVGGCYHLQRQLQSAGQWLLWLPLESQVAVQPLSEPFLTLWRGRLSLSYLLKSSTFSATSSVLPLVDMLMQLESLLFHVLIISLSIISQFPLNKIYLHLVHRNYNNTEMFSL